MTEPTQPRTEEDTSEFMFSVSTGMTHSDVAPKPWSPELLAKLEEFDRVRDRGAAEGANYWIGSRRG